MFTHPHKRTIDLNERLISHPAATFFVRVTESSKSSKLVNPGDVLIVDRAVKPGRRSMVLAIINGKFVLRRKFSLGKGAEVWGVVTYVIHKTC